MQVTYQKLLSHTFVIDEDKLKKLIKLLQDLIGNVRFQVSTYDGITSNFEAADDLIAHENPKSKKIERINLHATSDDSSRQILIMISEFNILINVTANEDDISKIADRIQDIFAGMRPWYDVLARYENWVSVGIAILVTFVGLLSFKEYISLILKKVEELERYALSLLMMIFPIYSLSFASHKLFMACFPHGVFAIGQGHSRFKRLQWVHGFMATFLISLFFFMITLVIN